MADKRALEAPAEDDAKRAKPAPIPYHYAPPSYFALDQLTRKKKRQGVDVGSPVEATRVLMFALCKVGSIQVGAWHCTPGGWPSAEPRPSTETFHVLSGSGSVSDADGEQHTFGAGDTVCLPKGWAGRWDVTEALHKIWVVHNHPDVEGAPEPARAVVTPLADFALSELESKGVRGDADWGEPTTATKKTYSVGHTSSGAWSCTPGGFPVLGRTTTECFHVLEGVFFLTLEDGTARRFGPGDTVVLPKGWVGRWDVTETVRKVWVVISD